MVHHGCRHEVICRFLQIGLSSRWGSIVADSSSVLDDELAMVAQALEGRSALLVDRQQEALAQFAEYRNVPRPDLDRSCARNVARVVAILRGESGLPPDVVEDERLSGERRARQGIPAEVVVAAYRAVIGVIRDDYLETGPALGVSVDAILLGVRRLWILTDHMSSTLVSARHKVELERAREAEQDRITLLYRALDGSMGAATLLEAGAGYGFRDDADYWVVRGHADNSVTGEVLREIERVAAATQFAPIIAKQGETIVGIIGRQLPQLTSKSATVAFAGPARLEEIPRAAAEAASILDVARMLGRSGVVDRQSMSLLMTVMEQDDVGQLLRTRYIEPVRLGSNMADEIIETLRVFLECQRSVQSTAAAMSIHVNTLRYRIERFEALTERSLADTEVLVETWWALQYESAHRAAPR